MSNVFIHKFLVFDNEHLLKTENLDRRTNQAIKHPEPVLCMDAPWVQDNEMLTDNINVIYDDEEKLFKMWYGVVRFDRRGAGAMRGVSKKIAYAVSPDGIHWNKPLLGLVEVNGSKANNYVIEEIDSSITVAVIKDSSDPSTRRYKMIFTVSSPEIVWGGYHSPLCLAYSANGLVWSRPRHVNPVLRFAGHDCFSLFYDTDRSKYVLLTGLTPNLPWEIHQYESHNLVDWKYKGCVLAPEGGSDPADMHNLQILSPFRYGELLLGVLGRQHIQLVSGHGEGIGIQQAPTGVIDLQLAYSTDGQNWSRFKGQSPIIPIGDPGAPDEGYVLPALNPIVSRNGETWIYYAASRLRYGWSNGSGELLAGNSLRNSSCCMVAKMPEDRWVALEAGLTEGWLLCKPSAAPQKIQINADVLDGGFIEAELLSLSGEPLAGFGRKDCIAMTAGGKCLEVRWREEGCPYNLRAQHQSGILLVLYLRNARIYSYSFVEPDADGSLGRRRSNARWLDMIKRQNGAFAKGTDPAKGVPRLKRSPPPMSGSGNWDPYDL